MRASNQKTLAGPVALGGIGLHTGSPCAVRMEPAPENSGVLFLSGSDEIAARVENVFDTKLGTSIRNLNGRVVRTVEHLMAAVSISGLDNVHVRIDGDELPVLDGSAAPFVEAIAGAGLAEQKEPRRVLRVDKSFEIVDGDRWIRASPHHGRLIDVSIRFEDEAIGSQRASADLSDAAAQRRLARARTFCRLADVDAMRSIGLSLGGSLDNAVVVDGDRIMNDSGLRDPSEFAYHKMLDLVGDLALAGAPLIGKIEAARPGHDLNVRFVKELLASGAVIERRL